MALGPRARFPVASQERHRPRGPAKAGAACHSCGIRSWRPARGALCRPWRSGPRDLEAETKLNERFGLAAGRSRDIPPRPQLLACSLDSMVRVLSCVEAVGGRAAPCGDGEAWPGGGETRGSE